MSNLKWWGYKHINGSYQVKRYWDLKDFEKCKRECLESDFVADYTTNTFEANSREDALNKIIEILK